MSQFEFRLERFCDGRRSGAGLEKQTEAGQSRMVEKDLGGIGKPAPS
jgi:hypothetical protein